MMARNIVSTSVSPRFFSNNTGDHRADHAGNRGLQQEPPVRTPGRQGSRERAGNPAAPSPARRSGTARRAHRTPPRSGCRCCAGADSRRRARDSGCRPADRRSKTACFRISSGPDAHDRMGLDHLPSGAPDDDAMTVGIGLAVRVDEGPRALLNRGRGNEQSQRQQRPASRPPPISSIPKADRSPPTTAATQTERVSLRISAIPTTSAQGSQSHRHFLTSGAKSRNAATSSRMIQFLAGESHPVAHEAANAVGDVEVVEIRDVRRVRRRHRRRTGTVRARR